MSDQLPREYHPLGSQCIACRYAHDNCSTLDFANMPHVGKYKEESKIIVRVACGKYEKA